LNWLLHEDGFRPPLRGLLGDVRYAMRRWRRRPGFAATAILTLALGIGATTAIFSVVDTVLLSPLPWPHADRLVAVHGVYPDWRNNPGLAATWNRGTLNYPAWDALRTTGAFQEVGVWRPAPRPDMTFGEGRTEVVTTMSVSSNFLSMLGVNLALGRYFTDREDNVNNDSIILSFEMWQRRLSGRGDIVGERLMLGRASSGGRYPKTVVGVLEPGFEFEGESADVLLPVGIAAEVSRKYNSGSFRVVARLSADVSPAAAEAAATPLVAVTDTTQPLADRVVALEEEHRGAARRPLWLLFGGAGLLLLVACANVAGLLLGEARMRRHEIAVRAALGSGRIRLLRQLIVEHSLMAVVGTGAGLVIASWLIGGVVALAPEGLPRIEQVAINVRVAGFALMAGLLTLLVFGVLPASTLARTPVARVLAEGGRDGAVSRGLGQRALVVGEIAIALVLLAGAGLFGETIFRLTAQPLGFSPQGVAVVSTTFAGNRFGQIDGAEIRRRMAEATGDRGRILTDLMVAHNTALSDRVLERLAAIPGVSEAAGASSVPFVVNPSRIDAVLEGQPRSERHDVWSMSATADYFNLMSIHVIDGRTFEPADAAGDRAVLVSREFQRRFFPDGAVDHRFDQVYGEHFELSVTYRIVGVVEDVKRGAFTDEVRPTIYGFNRGGGIVYQFVVKTSGDPSALLPALRQAIPDVDPQLIVTALTTLDDRVAQSVVEERFRATLSVLFAAAALVLATVGLYGLMARRSADRRREFGVRVALGARPADVRGLVFRDALIIVVLGLLVGLPSAFAAAQVTQSLLYGVTPTSPHVFAATGGLLGGAALAATLLPARRAARANPLLTLKE